MKYLGEAIRDMNEKTSKKQHMQGIKHWIDDYKTMVSAGNVKGAKSGKINIEKAMKQAGLSDKEKKGLWEDINESEELNEKLNQKLLDQISDKTDRNDHAGALMDGAKAIKDKQLTTVFKNIRESQMALGSLVPSLKVFRDAMSKELDKRAKKKLSPDDFKAWYGAY